MIIHITTPHMCLLLTATGRAATANAAAANRLARGSPIIHAPNVGSHGSLKFRVRVNDWSKLTLTYM